MFEHLPSAPEDTFCLKRPNNAKYYVALLFHIRESRIQISATFGRHRLWYDAL